MIYVVCVLCFGCIIIQCYVKIDSSININQAIFVFNGMLLI